MERRRQRQDLPAENSPLRTKRRLARCLSALALCLPAAAEVKAPLLRVEATYIAFSYDLNQFWAQEAAFELKSYKVTCRTLAGDLPGRAFLAMGGVKLEREGETLTGDALAFDPASGSGRLWTYGESVAEQAFGPPGTAPSEATLRAVESVSLADIRQSLLYAVCRAVDISPDYEAIGREVTLFMEGLESVGFQSLKLSVAAPGERRNGLSLNKLWYNRTQGLYGRAGFSWLKPDKLNSFTQLDYEEHSIIKDYGGLPRQADLLTRNSLTLSPGLSLGLNGNFNTSGLLTTQLWLNRDWAGKKVATLWDLTYSRPLNRPTETWLGLKASVEGGKAGRLSLVGRYEFGNQAVGDLNYALALGDKLSILLHSAYSRVRLGSLGGRSNLFEGNLNVSYSSRLFNLAADYHLNADLAESQTLSRPQLRMGLNPFPLYAGLLEARLTNVFLYSDIDRQGRRTAGYSNNTALSLSALPLPLGPGLLLDFTLALEQFLEKEKRDFTSGGLVLNLAQELASGLRLEGFYSLQSRRRTKGGLLEGTTNQDLSAVLRLDPEAVVAGWLSLSYDPKNARLKQSFADVKVNLFKGWFFHSLLNYDFLLNKLQNIDLYLIREAGRFELRFIWRSLSRQIMVELVPR